MRNVAYSAGNTLSDMAIYDRIEVLKGASGLLSGAGSLGGTINLVRKNLPASFMAISLPARVLGTTTARKPMSAAR